MLRVLLICVLLSVSLSHANPTRPSGEALPHLPGLWNSILWRATNGTGRVSKDFLLERLFKQVFDDRIMKSLENRSLFGTQIDPLWLWPLDEAVNESGFKARFKACDLHVHNLRKVELFDVQVMRDVDLGVAVARMAFSFPILWLTGYYTLRDSCLFGFIPVKDRQGDFNIDIKDISAYVNVVLNEDESAESGFDIGELHIDVNWSGIEVKFERIAGRFSTIADLTLNQLGLGLMIVNKQKEGLLSDLLPYTKAMLGCALEQPVQGIELCMRGWWETQGWFWPWEYPECVRYD